MKTDLYETITNQIIENLESVNPDNWEKPWFDIGVSPFNAISKKAYRGINHIVLGFRPYASKAYATYNQWAGKKCQVKKGEKGHMIVFWNFKDVRDPDSGEVRKSVWLKHYTVFNSEQVEGDFARAIESKPSRELNTLEAMQECESFIAAYLEREKIPVTHEDRAFYRFCELTGAEKIGMPKLGQFSESGAYYATFLHEMTHSTGNAKRLNREKGKSFGSENYAKEELVAELGSAMLCGHLAISQKPRQDHAEYIASWLKALKGDKRFIFSAAGQAQKAADFMIGKQEAQEETEQESVAA